MILPKTVSSDVIEVIGKGPIVDNLKKKPLILLKFFLQAVQSHSFCKYSQNLLITTASNLLCLMRSEILHWSTVCKTMDVICRYYSPGILKYVPDEGISQRMCLIPLMMRNCRPLREQWLDNKVRDLKDKSLRHYVDRGECELLLQSCITECFGEFRSRSVIRIRSYILQSRDWGWKKGEEAFENLYAERVNDARSAGLALYFAQLHGFQKVFEKAVRVLGSLEFFISSSSKGYPCYTQLTVGYPVSAANMYLSFEERKRNDEVAFRYHRRWNEPMQAMGIYGSNNILSFNVLSEEIDLKDIRILNSSSDKCFMPRNKIKHLSFDDKFCLSYEFFLGILIYFDEIDEIEILNYKITIEFIKELGRIRPGLKFLKFSHCENFNADLAACLPSLFPNLKSLYLEGIELPQNLFTLLGSLVQVDQFYLDGCRFSLPEKIGLFPMFTSIAISNDKNLSALELNRIWKSCPNVEDLCVVGLDLFDPRSYPYPKKIKNISAGSEDFNRWIENGKLILIGLFPNLMSIHVYGNEYSGKLARELLRIRKDTAINVQFREYK